MKNTIKIKLKIKNKWEKFVSLHAPSHTKLPTL